MSKRNNPRKVTVIEGHPGPAPVNPYGRDTYEYAAFERLVTLDRPVIERTRPEDLDTIIEATIVSSGVRGRR